MDLALTVPAVSTSIATATGPNDVEEAHKKKYGGNPQPWRTHVDPLKMVMRVLGGRHAFRNLPLVPLAVRTVGVCSNLQRFPTSIFPGSIADWKLWHCNKSCIAWTRWKGMNFMETKI